MSKAPSLSNVTNILTSESVINTNWELIEEAFQNTLSLDGSTPNQMEADIDLNSNDLLNVKTGSFNQVRIQGVTIAPNDNTAIYIPEWTGDWSTSTSYDLNDLVQQSGNAYICIVAHTSGTFATDLSSGYWELFAAKGASGAGSGDLVASNNLSDVDDTDTALVNLGGGTTGINLFKEVTVADARSELGLGSAALMDDSSDTDLDNDPNAAARRDIVQENISVTKLEEITISNDTTIEVSLPSGFSSYSFVLSDVLPTVDGASLGLRTSSDNGSTFDSGSSDYAHGEFQIRFGTTNVPGAGTESMGKISAAVGNNTASGERGVNASLHLINRGGVGEPLFIGQSQYRNDSNRNRMYIGLQIQRINDYSEVDVVQFLFDSGNLDSGKIILYGHK